VADGRTTLTRYGLLFGDVWLCAGQGNMALPLAAANAPGDLLTANYPRIRLFTVAPATAATARADVDGRWALCEPDAAGRFSAVAYYAGRALHHALNVPIGLVQATWAGTPIAAWTPPDAPAPLPAANADPAALRKAFLADFARWQRDEATLRDPGNTGEPAGWAKADCPTADWGTLTLPGCWEDADPPLRLDGAVWFRRTVLVPAAWAGKSLTLKLGAIDDGDTTYFDGVRVGATGPDTPHSWGVARAYTVPGALVTPGLHTLAVRVFDTGNTGGFTGPGKAMTLGPREPSEPIALAGPWAYHVEFARDPAEIAPPPAPPLLPGDPARPAGLFNGMIAPLAPLAITGVLWYQGEADIARPAAYQALFPALIAGWRAAWGAEVPFFFVQLPNFGPKPTAPGPSAWAAFREAQTAALALPRTGMAVTLDLGEANTLTPPNKAPVGQRLALLALATVYGKPVEASGPAFRGATAEGRALRLRFTHCDGGLVARGPLAGFAVAGPNGVFTWADARLEGDTVLVWSDKVARPTAVRYAWNGNPAASLYNKAGLPAAPFRWDAAP
jgi:sialate O-acetylesterase